MRIEDQSLELLSSSCFLMAAIVALILSLIWHFVWFTVFFVSTCLADIATSKKAFVTILWLSAVAESAVRYGENAKWVEVLIYARRPLSDVRHHGFKRMRNLILVGLILTMSFLLASSSDYGLIIFSKPLDFIGLEGGGPGKASLMLDNWNQCFRDFYVLCGFGISVIFRASVYYKRRG